MQKENGVFEKEYILVTDSVPKEREGVYKDFLFKDSKKDARLSLKAKERA